MNRVATFRLVYLGVLAAALLLAAWVAMHGRGPWYDELYTYYVTRPGAHWAQLWPAWLRDNHPPTFYALVWATSGLGPGMADRRLVNLLFMALAGAGLAVLFGRRREMAGVGAVFAAALASYMPAVDRASELRSNFLAYVAAGVAVAALAALARPGQVAPSRRAALFLAASLMAAFSVHLAATMIVGAVALAFWGAVLAAGDWRGALRLAGIGAVAALPFAVSMAVQLSTIAANTHVFWIPAGLSAARWAIEGEIIANLAANPPLTLAGGAGLAMLALQDLRGRRLSGRGLLVLTLMAGVAMAIALLVAVHLWRPFVIDRYLVALNAPIGMAMAVGVAQLCQRIGRQWAVPVVEGLVVLGALWGIHASFERALARRSWDGTGAAIAAAVRACPATRVYADMAWNEPTMALPPVDNRAVMPFAYGWVAARNGFALAQGRALSATCPTLFWTEHVAGQDPAPAAVAASLRARGYGVSSGTLRHIGDGWIFSVPATGR